MKIKYENLSTPLKTAIVLAWISGILNGLSFLAGFILGLLGLY